MLDDTAEFMDVMNANMHLVNGLYLGLYILGLFAVVFKWQMKRNGYYLYLFYTLGAILIPFVYFPGVFMWFFVIFNLVFGGLFAGLYGAQLKSMR
jgi:hypothetical protein